MAKLSLIGKGSDSIIIPTAAAINACNGFTNSIEPRKATINPVNVPSIDLFLLKKIGVFPKIFPEMLAKLSPIVSTVIDV